MRRTSQEFKVISNPLDGYAFSLARCHAAEIGAYVIGIGIAALISALFVCTSEKGRGWQDLRDNIWIPILCALPLLCGGLSMTYRIRKVKRILTHGEKTDGEIISYCRILRRSPSPNRLSLPNGVIKDNYTILNVEFYHNGKQKCTVGAGHKYPEQALSSPRCTVYILDHTVYVTGFTLRQKRDAQISFKRES